MRTRLLLLFALVAALAVAGTAGAQEGAGTVTVVHGVPGATVDVYVNGELTLESFEFGTITDPLELPAGDYQIDIRAAGDPADAAAIISGSATLPAGADASIVAHLAQDATPMLSVFVNDVSAIAAGETRLTVRHTAAAPTVDVLVNGEAAVQRLSNPDEAGPLAVPADTYSVAIAPAGETEPVYGPIDVTLEAGTAYAVYAVGSLEDGTFDTLVQATSGLGEAPAGVPAGTSGLVESSTFPVWGMALLSLAGLAALASGVAVARGRSGR
jgi:hypothetical protein